MYICICHGITDKDIKQAVQQGLTSIQQLSDAMGVGSQCGICRQNVCKFLDDCSSRVAA